MMEGCMYSMKVLEKVENMSYVLINLILHGEEDTAVSVGGSIAFAEAVKGRFGNGKVDLR